MSENMQEFDVIIIGAGPAGLAAAIYTARAALSTLVIDESSAGGQVKTTHQVANYPGFIEPVAGHELAGNMRKQAEKYGTRFKLASEITALGLGDRGDQRVLVQRRQDDAVDGLDGHVVDDVDLLVSVVFLLRADPDGLHVEFLPGPRGPGVDRLPEIVRRALRNDRHAQPFRVRRRTLRALAAP